MSKEYDTYIEEHISNVQKAVRWLFAHDIIPQNVDVSGHDLSKRSKEEYDAYDDYFYGKDEADEDDQEVINEAFDYAWLHHIHHNPHHWQYWVLISDDEGTKALEMPEKFVYEMIADWWSFSWKSGNLREIFDWYEKHKSKMRLHPDTKKLVEKILNGIKWELDREDRIVKFFKENADRPEKEREKHA